MTQTQPSADAGSTTCGVLWVFVGETSALTPEAVVEKLAPLAARLPASNGAPAGLGVSPVPLHQVRTVELRFAWTGEGIPAALEDALSALPPSRADLRVALLLVSEQPPAIAAGHPAVAMHDAVLTHFGTGTRMSDRLHLATSAPDTVPELSRLLHRWLAAEFLLARHGAETQVYATELGSELQFIERSINKILRFRLEGPDRGTLIKQLEDNFRDLSANYAKLNRNAGIFRDAVKERERLVELWSDGAAALAVTPLTGRPESVLSPRLDVAQGALDNLRRQDRDLQACLQTAQTAITMQGMNVELLRSGELVELQKHTGELLNKGVALQAAAVLIEFVVLFAYSLHSWEIILGGAAFHAVPGWLRFLAPLIFSGGVVMSAHAFADFLKEKHIPKGTRWWIATAVLALAAMISAPWLFPVHHGETDHSETAEHGK